MEIFYSRTAVKAINSYDKPTKARIRAGIMGLTQKPPSGDIKLMQGYSDGRCRLRIGGYRIIFRYDTDNGIEVLSILDVGSRGDIYK